MRRIVSASMPHDAARPPRARSRARARSTSSTPVDVVGRARPSVDEALGEQHVHEREQEEGVGAGPDEQVLVGLLGGLRAARVDDDELPAARRAAPRAGPGSRARSEAAVRRERVRAEHQQVVGAVEVGDGIDERGAEHQPGRHLLRHLVDRARRVNTFVRAERLQRAPGRSTRPRGCARSGCRGRRATASRPCCSRIGGEAVARSRRTPRPTTTSRHVASPPSRISGARSRSGSASSCLSAVPFGQRKPWLNTSSRSPRTSAISSPRRGGARARRWPRRAGRCGTRSVRRHAGRVMPGPTPRPCPVSGPAR